ncbi:MAG: phosphate ABC transporter permease PstA [Sphaerochaetaceae bacterium]
MNRIRVNATALFLIRFLSFIAIALLCLILGYITYRGLYKSEKIESETLGGLFMEQDYFINTSSHEGLRTLSYFTLQKMALGKVSSWRSITSVDEPFSLYIEPAMVEPFARSMGIEEELILAGGARIGKIPKVLVPGALVISANPISGMKTVQVEDQVLVTNPKVMELYGNNRVTSLSKSQLEGVLSGDVSSWDQVGGPNLPTTRNKNIGQLSLNEGSYGIFSAKEYLDAKKKGSALSLLPTEKEERGANLTGSYLVAKTVESGKYGGIGTIILNTLVMVLLTLLVAGPLGISAAVYLEEYARKGKIKDSISSAIDILSGIPSIIFGLFGLLVFVQLCGWSFSLISGTLTVSLMILPTVIRTSQEAIKTVNPALKEASLALGATKLETIWHIVLPSSKRGIVTGLILAIGRSIGETAALIYTIGSSTDLVHGLTSSCRVLSMHIYLTITEGQSSDKAFASALVLVVMVLLINTLAKILMKGGRKS